MSEVLGRRAPASPVVGGSVPSAPRRRGPGTWLSPMLSALLRQRRRLLLATVAIALSVGYLAGSLNLLDRVSSGLDALAAAGVGRADLVIEGGVAYESPMEQVRRLVPASVAGAVAGVPGVAAVSPRIEDTAPIVGPTGTTLVRLGLSEQPIGANFPSDARLSSYRFVAGGPPRADDEVAIDQRSAAEGRIALGDRVTVVGRAGAAPYRVVGIVGTAGGGLPTGASLALLRTEEARRRFDRPTDDNTIEILLEPGADAATVATAIRGLLPAGTDVVDGPTAARHRQEGLNRSFTLIRSLILGFAGLALVVGMITVGNSLALLYAERRRTFAGFRLVGARPRQLLVVALIEAALLAAVASLFGLPIGLLLGRLIEAVLGALNTSVPVAGSPVSVSALAWAVVVGTAATVVAAVVPALRACRVPPIEAVVDSGPAPQRSVSRSLVTVGVSAAVVGVLAALLAGRVGGGSNTILVGVGAATVVVVIGLLPLALSGLVATLVGRLPIRPVALRVIAARDVSRNRSRTAATAAALILATAVVSGLTVFLSSFSASVDQQVRDLVTADLVVDSGTFTKGGLPDDLVAKLSSSPVVSSASGWQIGRGFVGVTPVRMTGIDLEQLPKLLGPRWSVPPPPQLPASSVLVSSRLADALGVRVGSDLPLTFTSGGTENLRVAGIFTSGDLLLGDAILDRSVLSRQVPATTDIAALVALSPDDASSRRQIEQLAAASGVDSVLRPDSFVTRRAEVLHGFERVIEWMLLFTLVQALIGVVNTLLLSIGERRRELGLLRASGAVRRQVTRMVLMEGVALAIVGTVVGLLAGLTGARLGVWSLSSLGLSSYVVPVGGVLVVASAAVVLGILATAVPASWASRVPPLDAVLDEGDIRARPRRTQRPRFHRLGRAGFHWTEDAEALTGPVGEPPPALPAPTSSSTQPPLPPPPLAPPLLTPPPLPTWLVPPGPVGPPPYTGPSPFVGPSPGSEAPVAAQRTTPPPVPASLVPSGAPPVGDAHLRQAIARLDAGAAAPVAGSLQTMAAALAPGEQVEHLVAGTVKGIPTVVARTERRLLVVADRPGRPLVESLHPLRTGVTVEQGTDGSTTLAVSDGRRVMHLADVSDPAEAALLAGSTRVDAAFS